MSRPITYFILLKSLFKHTFKLTKMEKLQKMTSEKSLVIFSKNSCCMSHTIKTLFLDLGVNPTIYELDEINRGKEIEQALAQLGCSPTVPVVFIGGQLVGGANQVMSLHLNRSLIPMLKRVGALWL
nr:At4g15670 [Arabidopsis thaliana]AAS76724.1 At4g15670 [Arabidopsis thaliana]